MRVALVLLLVAALACCGLEACGSASGGGTVTVATSTAAQSATAVASTPVTRTVPPPTPRGPYLNDGDADHIGDPDRDNSKDNDSDPWKDYKQDDNNSYHDSDDSYALSQFGSPASLAVHNAVAGLVRRYYGAIAHDDGKLACSLVSPILATATPLDAGKLGPSYLHGARTCPQIMHLLSRHFHSQLRYPMVVTGVRAMGERAMAELASKTMPAGWITLQLEGGSWRIAQLFGGTIQ